MQKCQRSLSAFLVVICLSQISFARNNVHDWNKYGEDPGLGKFVGGLLGVLWGAVGGMAVSEAKGFTKRLND